MEPSSSRGTMTSLAAEYPPEEAHAAAARVGATIAAAESEAERLRGFISDNDNLVNLVQRLPDKLHHDVMVPFGAAAFFPGRLVHTNEVLVFLGGDGYFADVTAKQAVEILRRRGKALESQIGSLNAVVRDLRAEASFFETTASEITESGIVEIREDYVEGSSVSELGPVEQDLCEADEKKVVVDEEEFARIMARLDELEKEELDDEAENESDDAENDRAGFKGLSDEFSLHRKPEVVVEEVINKQRSDEFNLQEACTGLTAQATLKDGPGSRSNTVSSNTEKSTEKSVVPNVVENKVQAFTSSRTQAPVLPPVQSFDSRKAFTGSIVERADNLETSSRTSQASGSQPSKPISRFKMLRK